MTKTAIAFFFLVCLGTPLSAQEQKPRPHYSKMPAYYAKVCHLGSEGYTFGEIVAEIWRIKRLNDLGQYGHYFFVPDDPYMDYLLAQFGVTRRLDEECPRIGKEVYFRSR